MSVEMMEKSLSASDCPACWEELGDNRIPYSLTCGHTLCFKCIKRLAQNSSRFGCPLCREIVPLTSVKRNFTLYQLLSQLKTTKAGTFNPALTTSFDSIIIEQLIDRGASGEVHRGVWQNNDVAVKIFASSQITSKTLESFRREVCVMSSLRHPNVVLLLAACPEPPRLAIVMEFVKGGSLYSHLYIIKTPFELQDMIRLLIDISRGLQYLHSINILHRDLKSKNVLLTSSPPNCQGKLCDFGLARMRLESATMTGNIGTVHWTAPEVLNCARYHFAADVYGLGMVIYEIITRTLPFSALPVPAVIVAVLLRREKPKIPPECNRELTQLVTSCLMWEANDRPSISSVLHQLYSLLPPNTISAADNTDGLISFDHTDSLGHVVVEVELDETDIDSDLMEFLLAAQNDEKNENADSNMDDQDGQEEDEEKDDHKDFDSPLFIPTSSGGGVLSDQELKDISRLPRTLSIGNPHTEYNPNPYNPNPYYSNPYYSNPYNPNTPNAYGPHHHLEQRPRHDPSKQTNLITPKYSHHYRRSQRDVPELVLPRYPTNELQLFDNDSVTPGEPAMSQQFQPISNTFDPYGNNPLPRPKKTLSDPSPHRAVKGRHSLPSHIDEDDKTLHTQASHDGFLNRQLPPPQYSHDQTKTFQHEGRPARKPKKDDQRKMQESSTPNRDISPLRLESGGVLNYAERIDDDKLFMKRKSYPPYNRVQSTSSETQSTEEDDFELAQSILRQEQEEISKKDYHLASRLQKEYSAPFPSPPPRPPEHLPPLPPPLLPINQLPIMPTRSQLLMSQLSTLGRYRKLKPVRTVEKRGVRLGKVVHGLSNDITQNTVQNEIVNFNKSLLFPVELKEPPPPYPVGRVAEDRLSIRVRKIVKRMNSEIHCYDKKVLRHISYVEKNPLPTAEVIESEKYANTETISDNDNEAEEQQHTSDNNGPDPLDNEPDPSLVRSLSDTPPLLETTTVSAKTKKASGKKMEPLKAKKTAVTKGSSKMSTKSSSSSNPNPALKVNKMAASGSESTARIKLSSDEKKVSSRDSDHQLNNPASTNSKISTDTVKPIPNELSSVKHKLHKTAAVPGASTKSDKKQVSEISAKNKVEGSSIQKLKCKKLSSLTIPSESSDSHDVDIDATPLNTSITKKGKKKSSKR